MLHLLLVALENCTFACPENEQYLVKLSIAYEGKSLGFAENLVSIYPDDTSEAQIPFPKAQVNASAGGICRGSVMFFAS